jgi:two-component system response regulator
MSRSSRNRTQTAGGRSYIRRIPRKRPFLRFQVLYTLDLRPLPFHQEQIHDMTRRPRTVSGTGTPGRGGRASLPTILLVDADEIARAMVRDALLEGARPSVLRAVSGPAELGDYLHRRGAHADPVTAPAPTLVLVDLDLPDGGGIAAIHAAKAGTGRTPVIALTSRGDDDAVAAAYEAGANTVLPRPITFLALVRLIKVFTAYWLESALLPPEAAA